MTDHVLLTGATGFLGAHLARRLAGGGRVVHALARSSSDRDELAGLKIVWHDGDLRDRDSIERALTAGRRAAEDAPLDVVHCAALISYRTRDAKAQEEINVEGTRAVLAAARRVAIRRFLHISSVVAVGHSTDGEDLSEESPYNGTSLRVDYVRTKRAAEELVLAAAGDLDVVVANPGAIFGPAPPRSNSAFFLRRMAAGGVPFVPPGTVGTVGVEDTADGCVRALERGGRGKRYLLSESNLGYLELSRLVAEICGTKPPIGAVAPMAWKAGELAARAVDRLRPLERLTPQSMRMIGSHFRFDSSRARRELGWRPRPIREVLEETIRALGR